MTKYETERDKQTDRQTETGKGGRGRVNGAEKEWERGGKYGEKRETERKRREKKRKGVWREERERGRENRIEERESESERGRKS